MDLTQEELEKLEGCYSREEWTVTCDEIKAARDGAYPPDWWQVVKLSGMMARITARWGSDDEIHIVSSYEAFSALLSGGEATIKST